MALDAMRKAQASYEVRELIEMRMKAQHDEATRLEDALLKGRQEGRQEGLGQGLQQGRQEGRQEGLGQGLQQGRQEGRQEALLATARRMIEAGMDRETVARLTGLGPEDVQD